MVLFSLTIQAQEKKQQKKTDSIAIRTERFGLRVGADLFKLSRSFYEKDYKGLELVGDYRLTKRYFIAGEIGNENKTVHDDRLNFTTKGTYFRAGFDYNLYDNWLDMENMVYIGLRYGVSSFSQTLNTFETYNRHDYFNETAPIASGQKFSELSAQWLEVVLGIKAKVINNFYIGLSLRANKLMSDKKPENFDNLYIPGFHRTYGGDFGVGFNYTVSYFFPIYKTKTEILAKKAGPKKKKK